MGLNIGKVVSSAVGGITGAVSNLFGGNSPTDIRPDSLISATGVATGNPMLALGSGLFSLGSTLFANDQAEASAKKAFERNLYMWNLNNQYNSPVEQMARLKAAGLNPNLVYGSGNVVGNTSNGGYGSYGYDVYKPTNVVQEYQQLMANDASIRNTEAEINAKANAIFNNTRETTARINLMKAQARKSNFDSDILSRDIAFYNDIDSMFGNSGGAFGKALGSTANGIGRILDFVARGGLRALVR